MFWYRSDEEEPVLTSRRCCESRPRAVCRRTEVTEEGRGERFDFADLEEREDETAAVEIGATHDEERSGEEVLRVLVGNTETCL